MVKDKKAKSRQKEEIKLRPKEKILKYLIENKNPQSVRAISGATLLDYKNTYNIVNDLQPSIISKEKIGNINLIKLNPSPSQEIYSVEKKRTEEFMSKNPELKIVKKYIEELNYPF